MEKKPFLRVAYLGDSHCQGGFGLGSLNWRNRMTAHFLNYFDIVEGHQFCSGGETIGSTMPDGFVIQPPFNSYSNANPIIGRNITAALNVNPDLILILHSGNHFANGFSLEYVKTLYTELAAIMNSAGKKFAFSTAGPRGTYFPGSDVDAYRNLCLQFNAWLIETYPDNCFDIWNELGDSETGLPQNGLLIYDGLHYWDEGHMKMVKACINDAFSVDEITGYDKINAQNLVFVDNGDDTISIRFSKAQMKYLNISSSTNGINFGQL
ncbi:MAG: SGNH/GDSL hydrolase family protein, partial [Chitinophagaceae bacterium]